MFTLMLAGFVLLRRFDVVFVVVQSRFCRLVHQLSPRSWFCLLHNHQTCSLLLLTDKKEIGKSLMQIMYILLHILGHTVYLQFFSIHVYIYCVHFVSVRTTWSLTYYELRHCKAAPKLTGQGYLIPSLYTCH